VSRLTFPPGLDDVGRNVAIRLTADTSRYQREMLAAGHVTGELMEEVTGLDEVIHRTARRAGIAFMGLGALMAANTAIWTNQAAQWEMAFADVVKTVEDTPQALRRVNRELRQMSARDIPVVAGELAQLATIAGQLGIETDNISKFVEVAARLGVAVDDMGAEQAIFMLAQFNNIMGESETDIDRVASALVEMGNTVATTEGQVMNFATRMAGAAAVVGMSSAEVIGISAAFTSVGVEAERGSTAVQRVLLAMNDAVSRGGIELERFSRLVGLTTDEFRRMFRENPAEIFARFLEELTEAGEDANLVLAQLGLQDQRLISSFLAMSQATEDLRTVMNRSTRAFQENTELVRESDEFFNTLILNVRQLRNGVEEFWRSLGQGLLPPLKLFVQMLQLVMNVLNRIPQPIMSLIGILTALGASLLLTVGFLMTLSRAFEMAFAVHFVGRVTAVRAAIAGLAAGLLDLASAARIMEASRLGAFFVNLGAGIREAMVAMVGLLRRVPMLSGAVNIMTRNLQMLRLALIQAASGFRVLRTAAAAAGGALAGFALAAGGIGAVLLTLWGIFRAGQWVWHRLTMDVANTTQQVDALADSLNIAIRSFGALEERMLNGAESARDFRQANADLIRALRTAADEAERIAILDELVFQLRLRTNLTDPEIQEMVDKVLGLDGANIEMEFNVDDSDFNSKLDAMETRIDAITGRAFALTGRGKGELTTQLEGWAAEIADLLEGDLQDQLRAFDMLELLEEEVFRGVEGADLRNRFAMLLQQAGTGEEIGLGFWDQLRAGFRGVARRGDPMEDVFNELGEVALGSFDDVIAAAEEAGVEMGDNWAENLFRAIAAQDLWAESLARDREELERLRNEALAPATELLGIMGDRFWELDASAQNAMIQQTAYNLVAQRGHQATLEVLEETMRHLEEQGEEFSAFGRQVSSLIDRIGQEWDRIEERMFRREIGRMPTVDAIEEVRRRLGALDRTSRDFVRQRERLLDELFRLEDRAVSELMSALDQWERLQERQAQLQEQHNERIVDLERDRARSLEDAAERLNDRFEDINRTFEQRLQDRADSLARWAGATERIFSEHTHSIQRIIQNLRFQEELFDTWQEALEELRRRGMTDEAIEFMGLDESPRALRQIQRLLAGSADEFAEISDLIERRMDASHEHVSENSQDLVQEMAESRAQALTEYEQSVADINQRFEEQVADLNRRLARELESIAEEMANIGADTGREWSEAVAMAMETGNEHIIRMAEQVEHIMSQTADNIIDSTRRVNEAMRNMIWPDPETMRLLRDMGPITGGVQPTGRGVRGLRPGGWFAQGSIFTGPRIIGVGEEDPEAVIPLNERGARFMAMTMRQFQTPSGGMGDTMVADRELRELLVRNIVQGGTSSYGPITVQADDPREMERKLEQRARHKRLTQPDRGRVR
jgi:TP901 family phage tail tape measure protein